MVIKILREKGRDGNDIYKRMCQRLLASKNVKILLKERLFIHKEKGRIKIKR